MSKQNKPEYKKARRLSRLSRKTVARSKMHVLEFAPEEIEASNRLRADPKQKLTTSVRKGLLTFTKLMSKTQPKDWSDKLMDRAEGWNLKRLGHAIVKAKRAVVIISGRARRCQIPSMKENLESLLGRVKDELATLQQVLTQRMERAANAKTNF